MIMQPSDDSAYAYSALPSAHHAGFHLGRRKSSRQASVDPEVVSRRRTKLKELEVALEVGKLIREEIHDSRRARRSSQSQAPPMLPPTSAPGQDRQAGGAQSLGAADKLRMLEDEALKYGAGAALGAGVGMGIQSLVEHERDKKRKQSGLPLATPPAQQSVARPFPRQQAVARQQAVPRLLNELTKSQHVCIQHAAASLLLMEPVVITTVGSFENMVHLVIKDLKGGRPRHNEVFGVNLHYLAKHEGTDSHWGFHEHLVRIPSILHDLMTAIHLKDPTEEGILRKTGNVRQAKEIISVLDNGQWQVDLGALDIHTLASIFKHLLQALPDPVLCGHLFALFLTVSRIPNVATRRRLMHLVVCMMPKVHRDVLEVVLLFLVWLSKYAHVDVRIGNRMDLTNIAQVMAPTLLRPSHRDPKPVELPHMIAAVLALLEDQHILHEVPNQLASVLHVAPPEKDTASLLKRFMHTFQHS